MSSTRRSFFSSWIVMEEDTCSICLDIIDYRTTLECNHFFCVGCYKSWNERSNLCPMCKTQIENPKLALDNSIDKVITHFDHISCLLEKIKSLKSFIPDGTNENLKLGEKMIEIIKKMNELGVSSRPLLPSADIIDQLDDVQIDMLASLIGIGMGDPSFLGGFR